MLKISQYRHLGVFVSAAAALFGLTPAAAETITLRSGNGAIELTGELIGYTPDSYIIDTVHGELRVAPELVNCVGADCPTAYMDSPQAMSALIAPDEKAMEHGDLILATHPENPISSLTVQQAHDVFAGKITNWSALGGEDIAIKLVATPDHAAHQAFFDSVGLQTDTIAISTSAVIVPNQDIAQNVVKADIAAVTLIGTPEANNLREVNLVNTCGIIVGPEVFADVRYVSSDGAETEIASIAPDTALIGRYTHDPDGPRARHLLDTAPTAYRKRVIADMLTQMSGSDRLSTTFRFREGSSRLDPRGALDQNRLIAFLESQPAGTEIIMVGFTDSLGTFSDNLRLSRLRAWQVAERINTASDGRIDHVTVKTLGYGEIAPTACNTDAAGRRLNRRVEIWIKPAVQG